MNILKKIPFGLFLIILASGIFSSQYFLQKKVPFPSRYLVSHFSPWNAYPEYGIPVKNNAMPDVIGQIYPWKKFTIDSWKKGDIPLWNPYTFSGTPHLANYQSQVFSPTNLIYFVLPFLDAWSIQILLQPFLAGIFMYLYMRRLSISSKGSVISALSFMFCGFITTWMAYGTLAYAILFLPLCLYAVESFFTTKSYKHLIILSLGITFSFFSGHFQTSLYLFGTVIFYVFWELFYSRDIKSFLLLIISSISGLFIAMIQIVPSLEFYQNSVREGIFQKMEVIPWRYFPTRIAPDFFGNPVTRNDWFGHYAEWNSYSGIIPLLISPFVFIKKINRKIGFFIVLFIISLLLSHDSFLVDLVVWLRIPVLSTSAASRIIVLSSFSIAVLAGFGFDRLHGKLEKKTTLLLFLVPMLFVIFLWCIVFFGNLPEDKAIIARNNSILPTGLAGLFTVFIIVRVLFKNKIIKNFALLCVVFLVFFEMLRFSLKWMPFEERKFVYPEVGTVQEYRKLSSEKRFYLDTHAENALMYNLPIADGYDPLYIGRYGEFVKFLDSGKLENGDRSLVLFPKNGTYTKKAIDILGIKYIAYRVSDGRAPWAFPYWEYPGNQLKEIFTDGKYTVFENSYAFPRAYMVYDTTVESDKEKILLNLFSDTFNASTSAIVEEKLEISSIIEKPQYTTKISRYSGNNIDVSVQTPQKGLLILSDVFYPGWKAYVDGQKINVERVNYVFRGVVVPEGAHNIQFKYEPESFRNGLLISVVGVLGLMSLAIIVRKHEKKGK